MGDTKATALRLLETFSPDLRGQLPRGMQSESDRFVAALALSVRRNPQLAECSKGSLAACWIACAQMGLMPDTPQAHCHLIPFRNRGQMEATLVMGYRGLIELAHRSGNLARIHCDIVRDNDVFRVRGGTDPGIDHEPLIGGERGPIRAAYCCVWLRGCDQPQYAVIDGEYVRKVMGVSRSSGGASSPWQQWPDEMWRKTSIRVAMRCVPQSREIALACDIDDRQDTGRASLRVVDGELIAPPDDEPPLIEAAAPKMGKPDQIKGQLDRLAAKKALESTPEDMAKWTESDQREALR